MSAGEVINFNCEQLMAEPTLDIQPTDITFKDKRLCVQSLGRDLYYFSRIEHEASSYASAAKTDLPNLNDNSKHLLDVCQARELIHGQILNDTLRKLNLQTPSVSVKTTNQLPIADLIHNLPILTPVLEYLYVSRAALREKLTIQGYQALANKMLKLGEIALANKIIKPIQKEQTVHLAYYQQNAIQLRKNLSQWQIYAARLINQSTYKPIAVHNHKQALFFGNLIRSLVDHESDSLSMPVQDLANKLFAVDPRNKFIALLRTTGFDQASDNQTYITDTIQRLASCI